MNFTSLVFLLFLAVVWSLYWIFPRRPHQNTLIVIASFVFYGYWDYRYAGLMLLTCTTGFIVALLMEKVQGVTKRKWLLGVSIVLNLAVLATFKYLDFFLESFREFSTLLGLGSSVGTLEIILPVGISFYTFQVLSYTIDVYRRQLRASRNLMEYLAFISFFPQLVAGPIERASNLLPQFEVPRRWQQIDFGNAGRRILWGYFKKIVIADTLATIVAGSYDHAGTATGVELFVATIFFAFQIYCDFSGYSDIAIGTAELFQIRLTRNFAYPYFSQNIREFWLRWHISLSTWFRDYVYIPLGGNRVSGFRQRVNLLVTFLLSGLWHGAAWQYIAWGGLHGTVVSLGQRKSSVNHASLDQPGGSGWLPSFGTSFRILRTFLIICCLWIFFRASSIQDALLIVQKIVIDSVRLEHIYALVEKYTPGHPFFFAVNLLLAFVVFEWIRRGAPFPLEIKQWPQPLRWSTCALVFWFVVEHADKTPSNPFVYFQF